MENTVRDFWKMVVDYRVPVVVMLCDLNEDNVRLICHMHAVVLCNTESIVYIIIISTDPVPILA